MNDDRWDDRDAEVGALIEAAAGPRATLELAELQTAGRRRRRRQRRAMGAVAAVTISVATVAAAVVLSEQDPSVQVAVDGDDGSTEAPSVPDEHACVDGLTPPTDVRPGTDDERDAVSEAILEHRLTGADLANCASPEVIEALGSETGSGCLDLTDCPNLASAEIAAGVVRLTMDDGRVHEELYQVEWVASGQALRLVATEVRFGDTHVRWIDPPRDPEVAAERYLAALAAGDFDLAALYMESTGREGPTGRDPNDPIVLQELAALAPEADLPELLAIFCEREPLCRPLLRVVSVDPNPEAPSAWIVTVQLDSGDGQPWSTDGVDQFEIRVGSFEGLTSVGGPPYPSP